MRLFKAGDLVREKTGGPMMKIVRYVDGESAFGGQTASDLFVRCIWYDEKRGKQEAVLSEKSIKKMRMAHFIDRDLGLTYTQL